MTEWVGGDWMCEGIVRQVNGQVILVSGWYAGEYRVAGLLDT